MQGCVQCVAYDGGSPTVKYTKIFDIQSFKFSFEKDEVSDKLQRTVFVLMDDAALWRHFTDFSTATNNKGKRKNVLQKLIGGRSRKIRTA